MIKYYLPVRQNSRTKKRWRRLIEDMGEKWHVVTGHKKTFDAIARYGLAEFQHYPMTIGRLTKKGLALREIFICRRIKSLEK